MDSDLKKMMDVETKKWKVIKDTIVCIETAIATNSSPVKCVEDIRRKLLVMDYQLDDIKKAQS